MRSLMIQSLLGLTLIACGSAETEPPAATETGGGGGTGASAAEQPTCRDSETRSCVGPGACQGGQYCDAGIWSACGCGDALPTGGTGGAGTTSGGAAGEANAGSGSTGGRPASGGTGGEPATGGTGGEPATGGTGGEPATGGTGGEPATGGTGGEPATGGTGGCTVGGTLAMIDDFERSLTSKEIPDQDSRSGEWYVSNDGSPSGDQVPSNSAMFFPTAASGNAGTNGLPTSATGFGDTLNPAYGWGVNFGLSFGICHDASAFDGIQFDVKSAAAGTIELHLPMAQTVPTSEPGGTCSGEGCWDTHFKTVALTDSWTTVTILWDDPELSQNQGWLHDNKYDFDPAQLLQIQWKAPGQSGYDLVIDNLSFVESPGGTGN